MTTGTLLYILAAILGSGIMGYILNVAINVLPEANALGDYSIIMDPTLLLMPQTWLYGVIALAIVIFLILLFKGNTFKTSKNYMKGGKGDAVKSSLENSRFMDDKEKDSIFPHKQYAKLPQEKKDGLPVYGVYNTKTKQLDINLCSPMHGIIIGATGSGKTTTFINPAIQIISNTKAGSSMICTDPKGELFQTHSGTLVKRGYKVMVLDLRDPYSSFRWNPLGDIYDRYQLYLHTGDEIYERTDSPQDSKLELVNKPEEYGDTWYEYEGKGYGVRRDLISVVKVARQKIYDELYEDLNDLVSVLCPIESQNDPVWEKGARSIILAVAMGFLEDSENPELEMTRDKFIFYNITKAIGQSEDEYAALKDYFKGRPKLSKAASLSRQVMSAADNTLSSYMSIALDKLSMFNDEGLCALTSDTDIDPMDIAKQPIALFLKIPDEKDTRHALAAIFILSIYKALIKFASATPDLTLPRNVYFLLDEFGNMPKIEKFDKMITVGRSRKIWFDMVVQSFAQLENVYGKTIADIIKGNCGLKMFIGSNDLGTCDEFSKLCGNYTVSTASVSSSTSNVGKGEFNVSSQLQQRPLIYPSELQKLNNKTDTGNAIIVTFGNNPLKTKFTPSYKCPLYEFSTMDLTDVKMHAFFGDEVYYDLDDRNYLILDKPNEEKQDGEGTEDAGQDGGSEADPVEEAFEEDAGEMKTNEEPEQTEINAEPEQTETNAEPEQKERTDEDLMAEEEAENQKDSTEEGSDGGEEGSRA